MSVKEVSWEVRYLCPFFFWKFDGSRCAAHNLEIRNFGNQWVQHRRGQFGGGLSERGHQSGACLGGTSKIARKAFRNLSSLNSIKKELWNCPFPDIFQHLPVFSRGYTTNACPSQTHEALGIGRPESARPELWNSCVENVAAKLLGVNSLADVSHLPVMEFRAILHLILHWFLFYHFFPFFSILFHSFPFFPIVSHFFRFFSHFCHSFY